MTLKVGVIGLGDIARKAYLPVLTAQPGLELHLHTRTPATLDRVGDAYRIPHRHATLDDLLARKPDAAFVHAPTADHRAIAERLLGAGVPTYVDKPLADNLADATHLVELAERTGTGLMAGFNRRYAPGYRALLNHPRDLIVLQKNRFHLPAAPRPVVFDDFIHVVDTLRFLVPGEVTHTDVRTRVVGGALHHIVLTLSGDGFTAIGIMNRSNGSTEEILEVMGRDTKRVVHDLGDVVDHRGDQCGTLLRRRGDWTPVPHQRGIEQITLTFLDRVRTGEHPSAADALETHRLCERIVESAL
ncbi:oxidoreductase [Actinomadura sp. NBRC 104412]|uniref:Gfo/Idh/MocA family protein n=1 Tax=Actinomadura sp. NBRC 104412 TaxID=3032203 RepID=UPI0024A08424|nr:Gfo/Idh/MocA family oxidoreductase [Actinomadura sp. NBRC 104412]GLZ07066.1 oxidoreductase [Actinomadura sp. NBRC 104412]